MSGNIRILIGKSLHILDCQTLELWNIDVFDLLTFDPLLLTRLNIS